MARYLIHLLFVCYTLMLFTRMVLSYFPSLYRYRFSHFLIFYTEPYLKIFRRLIPPIGGMFDLSPMIGFFALQFLESIILRLIP